MTKDDIIRMAREAGLHTHKEVQPEIVRFAELVADAKRKECAQACTVISADQWALYKGRAPYTGTEEGRASEYVQGQSDGADLCAARGQAPESSAVDPGAETGSKQAETRATIGLNGGAAQNPKKELEHDNCGPQCSDEEMLLRGILASELRCWHRLTNDEAENLVAFVKSMPPKKPESSNRVWMPLLKKARDGLSGGLWDYGPGQDEHGQCNELIDEIDTFLIEWGEE